MGYGGCDLTVLNAGGGCVSVCVCVLLGGVELESPRDCENLFVWCV